MSKTLAEELSLDEQETAARSSYAYWLSTIGADPTPDNDTAEVRMRFAMREARRHYVGQDRDFDKALTTMREAISLRKEYKIDLVRWIPVVGGSLDHTKLLSDEEKQTVKRYRGFVEQELQKQLTVTSGLDRENRAGMSTNKIDIEERSSCIALSPFLQLFLPLD